MEDVEEYYDRDILVSNNIVYEAKNRELGDNFPGFLLDSLRESLETKIDSYIKNSEYELVVSFRSESIPQSVIDMIDGLKDKHGIEITVRADRGYVENE